MKHINIRAHYIRDCVNAHTIDVHHISGVDNPADLLTRPLNKIIHAKWLKCLRLDAGQGGGVSGGGCDPHPGHVMGSTESTQGSGAQWAPHSHRTLLGSHALAHRITVCMVLIV
jgi:hypothetical protein